MKNDYLVRKNPMSALLIFALPIIIGNFFQQFYTMADSAIVGQYVSQEALAAVGASSSLTNVFIHVAMGGGLGASIVVGRYFGGKLYGKMKTAVSTALVTLLSISIVLGLIGYIFGRPIMQLLNTPADALDMSAEYLQIYFLGLPFLFMYNIFSSLFNALGKSRIPLAFLIFSSVTNIVLDIFMVQQMGVAGAAWATLIAQGISAIASFVTFMNIMKKLEGNAEHRFDKGELLTISKIALPSILQQSTVSIGMMLVQSVINSFGSEVLAGYSAAARVENICLVPMIGIGSALSSYVAQNIGAGKIDRVVQGYHAAIKIVVAFAVVSFGAMQLFNAPLIDMFLGADGTAKAMETGRAFLQFIGCFFCFIGFKQSVDGLLRGAGDMAVFTMANMINLGIRVAFAALLAPVYDISMVWIAIPIGWATNFVISYIHYRGGKWKTIYQAKQAAQE